MLKRCAKEHHQFDLIFLDGKKSEYKNYFSVSLIIQDFPSDIKQFHSTFLEETKSSLISSFGCPVYGTFKVFEHVRSFKILCIERSKHGTKGFQFALFFSKFETNETHTSYACEV